MVVCGAAGLCCYCGEVSPWSDYCCDHLCLTFTEDPKHHLWPQAIAFATMNTSLLNTYSHAEYLGGHVAKLGCVKLPTDSGHSTTVNWASLRSP